MQRNAVLLWVGLMTLAGLVGCGSGSGSGNQMQTVSVSVSPKLAAVAAGVQTQQFTATVTGDSSNSGVNWSVDGIAGGSPAVGNITGSGNYSAPTAAAGGAGTHTVTATSIADTSKSAAATVAVSDLAGVFTYHNDVSRDGANTQEYALNSSTVTTSTFGKLFSCTVDGAVYTQPLWVPGVSINGALHNVVYAATQHDSVYAFDADTSPCVTLWQVNLLDTLHGGTIGETPLVWNDVGNVMYHCFGDIYPEVGVTGTPVIDPSNGTIYLVSASEIPGVGSGTCSLPPGSYFHRLHALDITSGNEKFQAPVTIAAQVVGTGDGSSGGMVTFTSQLQHNRTGLALSSIETNQGPDSTVYVAFAAHEDQTPYHGWLLGYKGNNVQLQVSSLNTTPNGIGGADGGIWGGGGAPALDSGNNDVYVATGNGVFDQGSGMSLDNDYGDSVLRLSPTPGVTTPNGANLSLVDYFTPDTQSCLAASDTDLGSGAPVILPDQTSAGLPTHLLVQLGKDGVVYLLNRDNMGQLQTNNCTDTGNQIVQSFQATTGFWGTPAFWQNSLYFAGANDSLKQFSFDTTTGQFSATATSNSTQGYGFPDVSPSVSSTPQGTNGILWAIDAGLYGYASPNAAGGINCYVDPPPAACSGPAILHAYDATNLARELWNSSRAANNRDQAGNAVKFVPPTVANGKVYVSTRTEIDVYGLLPN